MALLRLGSLGLGYAFNLNEGKLMRRMQYEP